ncbi:MAG: hypothetical protein ACXWLA_01885 [Myxococcaceae bacterium]
MSQAIAGRRVIGAVVVGVLGCGTTGIGHDVEGLLTISQGVYGQTYQVDDVCPGHACEVSAVSVEMTVSGALLPSSATVQSGGRLGFYELALPVGDFESCVAQAFQRCTQFSVSPGQRIRRDLEYGVGGGFWK